MSAVFSPLAAAPIEQVEIGMPVMDSAGTPIGTVEDVNMNDPDAVTAAGNEFRPVSGWLGDLARAFSTDDGLEPHIREPMRTRFVRIGYLKLSAPGRMHHGRYVRADRIARVENGRVELALTSDQLNCDD
jgi:hypothetical protein